MLRARAYPTHEVTVEVLLGFKHPKLEDRRWAADAAKKAMQEKFRAALQDPAREDQRAKRLAIHNARLVRMAEREAAKKATEAKLAAQAAHEAELAIQAAREAEEANIRAATEEAERAAALMAQQKAERDARYVARQAAHKVRRRGY
jgi:membrane protein involved in colicin uptake